MGNVGNYINERKKNSSQKHSLEEMKSLWVVISFLGIFLCLIFWLMASSPSPSLLLEKVFYSSSGQFSGVWIGSAQCRAGACLWGGSCTGAFESRGWNASKPLTCDISVLSHPINEKSWQNVAVVVEVLSAKFYLVYCSTSRQQQSQGPSGFDVALTWTPLAYIWFPLWPKSRDLGASDQKFHFGLITGTGGWVYSFHGLEISKFFLKYQHNFYWVFRSEILLFSQSDCC